MKMCTLKRTATFACAALMCVSLLQSCGEGTSNLSNREVAELQNQLDSTMMLYTRLKSENSQFNSQMAERDSVITAQAAEIQSLIDRLGSKAPGKSAGTVDQAQLDSKQKEIREKENTIKQLQKRLDEQSAKIKSLQNASNSKEGDSKYKSQVADLQKQIAAQEKQIKDLKAETARLKANTKDDKSGCEQMKKDYESQVAELNGNIKTYKIEIADLNKQIKSLKADVASLRKQAEKENDAAASEELTAVRSELRQMTAQLNDCRKQNTQYQNDVKAANETLASVKADLANCQSNLDAAGSQVKTLQAAQGSQNEDAAKAQQAIVQQCENDKQTLQGTISDLRQQVMAMQARVEQLTAENTAYANAAAKGGNDAGKEAAAAKTIADLTAQVEAQRGEIAQLQSDLQNKERELAEAKSNTGGSKATKGSVEQRLADLQSLCDSYAAEIERLRAENEQLRGENATLKEQVAASSTLFAENERLQQKVKLASVLVTSDLKVTPGKSVKVGNVVKPTTKASQTKFVRIDCRLLDNNVVDPGSMTIFARISNAADRAISNGNADDYMFNMNGVQMQYTTKQDIEFTGSGRTLTMLWRKADAVELTPGLYWVRLYAGGYEIGKTSFKLE